MRNPGVVLALSAPGSASGAGSEGNFDACLVSVAVNGAHFEIE